MNRTDFGLGFGFMVLAGVVYKLSLGMKKVQLGIGPGDYPRVIAIGLFVLGGILVVQSLLKKNPEQKNVIPPGALLNVVLIVALTFAYIQLMRYFGFLYLTPFFLFAAMYHFGVRKPVLAAVTSVGVTVLLYVVFNTFFGVLLPRFNLF